MQKEENITLRFGYESSFILISSKHKWHQEQLHAKFYFMQRTASAESTGQCWTAAQERNISHETSEQLPLLWFLPLKMIDTFSMDDFKMLMTCTEVQC